ncbi:ESPR domain-containing protein [Variovorax paradoxus]|uniref:ESPR domain-containing protein n=1 Tax=Variovorax paradoxus TaxID=34073 RepID=UPI00278A2B4F|nr:ESPR domain-containing protein [Variovorax paradoxus]MDQ0586255.1 hypothetical protein [Variovorax paradoxus]
MNKSYRSIWNKSLGAWVAASEATKARGKRSSGGRAMVAVMGLVLAGASGVSVADYTNSNGTIT